MFRATNNRRSVQHLITTTTCRPGFVHRKVSLNFGGDKVRQGGPPVLCCTYIPVHSVMNLVQWEVQLCCVFTMIFESLLWCGSTNSMERSWIDNRGLGSKSAVSLFSTYVSSTCFGSHRSIIRSVLYKLYSQTLVCGSTHSITTYQSLRIQFVQNAPDNGPMRTETCRANISAE